MNIAIIPARGGSQRIPRKNIKPFLGKPLVSYSIQAALDSKLFDKIIVSTDDSEIASVAKDYGAEVPFMRSHKNASNHAGTVDVLIEVLEKLQINSSANLSVCCLYATAPFVTAELLKSSLEVFHSNDFDSLMPVTTFDFPIQRAISINEKNIISWREPEAALTRSQDLECYYHDTGQFYWLKPSTILNQRKIITQKTGIVKLAPVSVQDIDTPEDWEIAELKYRHLNKI